MTTPLIDVHAHFLTDEYVAAAVAAGHRVPDGMPSWPDWSPETHLALMDDAGIERSLLSLSSPGVHFGDDAPARALARSTNRHAAEVARSRPARFGFLATLPLPDVDGALAEAVVALDELGAEGVAIFSNAGGTYPGSAALDPLFDELDRRGALVLIHPTAAPGVGAVACDRPLPMIEFLFDEARAAVDMVFADRVARHPHIRWVFTHSGGVLPLLVDRVDLFGPLLTRRPFDLAEQLRGCWFDSAGTPLPSQLPALAAVVGTEHLVFGSDYCFTPAAAVLRTVGSLDTWRGVLAAGTRTLLGAD